MTQATDRPRVLCCWDPAAGQTAMLGRLPEVADVTWHPPDRPYLLDHLGDFDAYLASLHVPLDGEMIARAAAGRLRLVGTPTTGLDHLDRDALAAHDVALISIKTEYELLDQVTATAELAWGLMLAAVRKLPAGHAAVCRGHWARDAMRGHQLSGKTLGVLGVGRLGRMLCTYGQAFRMRVLGCDVRPVDVAGVTMVDLATLLRRADVISIHIHLTPENRGLLGPAAFAQMKDGVVLINTSRGAIIDEAAFVDALRSGKVGAAGLDVIDGEWRSDLAEHPLVRYAREHDNLVISPHVGGITYESQRMTSSFVANKVAEALAGSPVSRA